MHQMLPPIIVDFLPFIATVIITILVLLTAHTLIIKRHRELGNERLFSRQFIMLGLTLAGIVAITLALPISEESKSQLITLLGLIFSGLLAFSSSNVFANLIAGLMLRVTKPFATGDFISIENFFGKVKARGLLDTEIQSENKEIVTLPNIYIISHPVSVVHKEGVMISSTISIGYSVHHSVVSASLVQAAHNSDLTEPFVQITELGNFSITYKVSGLLSNVTNILTSKTLLSRNILDQLHQQGIEILSPTYMNQKQLPADSTSIPHYHETPPEEKSMPVEKLVFAEADKAERIEASKLIIQEKINRLKENLKTASGDEKQSATERLEYYKEVLQEINSRTDE